MKKIVFILLLMFSGISLFAQGTPEITYDIKDGEEINILEKRNIHISVTAPEGQDVKSEILLTGAVKEGNKKKMGIGGLTTFEEGVDVALARLTAGATYVIEITKVCYGDIIGYDPVTLAPIYEYEIEAPEGKTLASASFSIVSETETVEAVSAEYESSENALYVSFGTEDAVPTDEEALFLLLTADGETVDEEVGWGFGENYGDMIYIFSKPLADGDYVLVLPAKSMSFNAQGTPYNAEVCVPFTVGTDAGFVFSDGDAYELQEACEYDKVTYSRTFDNTDWQALYLPFALHYEEWSDDYDIAFINNVIEYDDNGDGTFDRTNLVVLKMTSGSTVPNYPYLIRAKSEGTHALQLMNKTFSPSVGNSFFCCSMKDTYTFTGTYSTVADMYDKGYYALADGCLKKAADASVMLKPQRWYLAITPRNGADAPAAVRMQSIGILVDGEEGIESLTPSPSPKENGAQSAYDLTGRVVGTATNIHGVTIVGGKKVVR